METSTLIYLASRWASLYMLWLSTLGGIFEQTARYCFAEIVQCQICFGLGDGQDTEEFLNIGVSLGCCHYFYTKACSLMTSGGDLCHVGMGKLIQINELVPA